MSRSDASVRATTVGGTAVLMWSTLGLLTTLSGTVPPFQLAAMAFTVAFLFSLLRWMRVGKQVIGQLRQPPVVWAIGVGGLFGYHFFYFMALRNAPPIEAGLIGYLWPMLIVVFSALLPGEHLRWWHIAGAFGGLCGTVLLVTGGAGLANFRSEYWLGYTMAVAAALTWSSYSLLSRWFGHVPTDTVGGFCGLTAVLAALCHLVFEVTVWPTGLVQWLAVFGLGLGPVGAAFFTWDHGVKHGNIQQLGALSYLAPPLSTFLLILFGKGSLTWVIAAGCLLIVGGAVLASKEMLVGRPARLS